jgi:hypothetical protein
VAAVVALGSARADAAYEAVAVKDGGTLRGVVRFTGTPPGPAAAAVGAGTDACGARAASETLVLGQGGGVKSGVVLIEGVSRGKRRAGDAVLESRNCRFVSHVSAIAVGDRVRVRNADDVVHSPQGLLGRSVIFTVALPGREQVVDITRRVGRPGVVRVQCAAHPHMSAWLVVHDSPYVAVTDERGAFTIDDVPPGSYRVTLWHEGYRTRGVDADGRRIVAGPIRMSRNVTIPPNSAASVQFELK